MGVFKYVILLVGYGISKFNFPFVILGTMILLEMATL
jgi:hypothetical protein